MAYAIIIYILLMLLTVLYIHQAGKYSRSGLRRSCNGCLVKAIISGSLLIVFIFIIPDFSLDNSKEQVYKELDNYLTNQQLLKELTEDGETKPNYSYRKGH